MVWGRGFKVGTDALVCPLFHSFVASHQATDPPSEGVGEAFISCVLADRRGRLSLLVAMSSIFRGGWVGFQEAPPHPLVVYHPL
ncbi:hypothetical protein HMPREF0973_00356 [Prevotella veroralis F0319]|uniref:Uncharacterized protein n=1 Tax=Prevotella veroralis F0319 TaxID=649761 RepID=C9ML81_9BACT|nr:hypothetical protein HMPREF0973_00356 [Prevotella veroralis F0319]